MNLIAKDFLIKIHDCAELTHCVPVSVVIPCYRCSKTIVRATSSVRSQDVLPFELILVDDFSCDETINVLIEIQNLYGSEWVKVIKLQENVGAASARNVGWEVSTGEYVAFLDSDDEWHPQKINIQYNFMNDNASIALSGHLSNISDGFNDSTFALYSTVSIPYHLLAPKRLLLANPFVTPSIMVKNALGKRFCEGTRYAEDFRFIMEVALDGGKIAILDYVLVNIHKKFCKTGLSSNKLMMRYGDIDNYYYLYRKGHIGLCLMIALIMYSSMKFVVLLLLGPRLFLKLRNFFW